MAWDTPESGVKTAESGSISGAGGQINDVLARRKGRHISGRQLTGKYCPTYQKEAQMIDNSYYTPEHHGDYDVISVDRGHRAEHPP